jgi:hypothetical protein
MSWFMDLLRSGVGDGILGVKYGFLILALCITMDY